MNEKMTAEKAIEQLNSLMNDRENHVHRDDFDDMFLQDIEALKIGISALEKQIPKKIVWDSFDNVSNGEIHAFYWACCPNCGVNVWEEKNEKFKFCSDCGQALDWSDENE